MEWEGRGEGERRMNRIRMRWPTQNCAPCREKLGERGEEELFEGRGSTDDSGADPICWSVGRFRGRRAIELELSFNMEYRLENRYSYTNERREESEGVSE